MLVRFSLLVAMIVMTSGWSFQLLCSSGISQIKWSIYFMKNYASNYKICFQISYVLDTEDFFIRLGRRRNQLGDRSSCNNQARVLRFHQFLTTSTWYIWPYYDAVTIKVFVLFLYWVFQKLTPCLVVMLKKLTLNITSFTIISFFIVVKMEIILTAK